MYTESWSLTFAPYTSTSRTVLLEYPLVKPSRDMSTAVTETEKVSGTAGASSHHGSLSSK